MPYLVNATITVDSTELTDYAASIGVFQESDDVDVSTMGTTVHKHLAGLRNDRFEATFLPDVEGTVLGTLVPLIASAVDQPEFTVSVTTADGQTYSSTKCIMLGFNPVSGNVGDRTEIPVVFPSNEEIVAAGAS